MCRMHGTTLWAILLLIAAGCSNQSGTEPSATTPQSSEAVTANKADPPKKVFKAGSPEAAVNDFLDAVRSGNDEKATALLSKLAREKMASLNRSVTPPASDNARYTVGKVEYLDPDRAAVDCSWTDLDPDGQPKTDEATWVLRREPEGWRVAGVTAEVFPNEPRLQLNFEDPDEMFKKQQWVREEIRRRMEKEAGGLQAQEAENQEKSALR
jgi:hypothetical protein